MRFLATIFCLFAVAPSSGTNQAREARQAEWVAALAGAATPQQGNADELPQPLREALRRWSEDDSCPDTDNGSAA